MANCVLTWPETGGKWLERWLENRVLTRPKLEGKMASKISGWLGRRRESGAHICKKNGLKDGMEMVRKWVVV